MTKPRIAILASGSGTTAEAVIHATQNNQLDAEVVLVISNKKDAGVFNRVKECNKTYTLSIKSLYISSKNYPASISENWQPGRQTNLEEVTILDNLKKHSIDLVLLLGYMKLVGDKIVSYYGYRSDYRSPYLANMLNTHPGLLPATKGYYGKQVQTYVLENRLQAGHCLFAVDVDYDGGPVITEHMVEVKDNDTAQTLFERVQSSERSNLPYDINSFIQKQRNNSKGDLNAE